jgi:hypothetical protein
MLKILPKNVFSLSYRPLVSVGNIRNLYKTLKVTTTNLLLVETCATMLMTAIGTRISAKDFYAWVSISLNQLAFFCILTYIVFQNPSIKADCSGFRPGTGESYCIAVQPAVSVAVPADADKINFNLKPIPPPGKGFQPSPGAPSNCTNWYASRDTDECGSLAGVFGVSKRDFLA